MTFAMTTVFNKPWDGEVYAGYFIMYFTRLEDFEFYPLKASHNWSIHCRHVPEIPEIPTATIQIRDMTSKRYIRSYGTGGLYLSWVTDDPIYAAPYFDAFTDGYTRGDAVFDIISVKDHAPTTNPPVHEFLIKASNGRYILPHTALDTEATYDVEDTATATPNNVTYIFPRMRHTGNDPLEQFFIRSHFGATIDMYASTSMAARVHSSMTAYSRFTFRLVPGAPGTTSNTYNIYCPARSQFLAVESGGTLGLRPSTTAAGADINFQFLNSRTAFPTIVAGTSLLWVIYHPSTDRYLLAATTWNNTLSTVPATSPTVTPTPSAWLFWEFAPASYADPNCRNIPYNQGPY